MTTVTCDGAHPFGYGYVSFAEYEDSPVPSSLGNLVVRYGVRLNGSIAGLCEYRIRWYGLWRLRAVCALLDERGVSYQIEQEGTVKGYVSWRSSRPSGIVGSFGYHLTDDGGRIEETTDDSTYSYRIWYRDNVERVGIQRRLKQYGIVSEYTKVTSVQRDFGSNHLPGRTRSSELVMPRDSIVSWKGL